MLFLNIILFALVALLGIGALVWVIWRPKWMGFEGATLWDWMKILPVPIFIGFSTMYFNVSQRELERLRQEEISVQNYVDRMSALVLEPNKTPEHYALAQAQTSAVLNLASQDRATRALQFLDDFDLLRKLNIDLVNLDFSNAEMKGLHLDGIDFEGSSLFRADLEDGHFARADFEGADLRDSDLKGGDFSQATFEDANIKGADLSWTDLRGADLRSAIGLTQRQIDKACIDQSTLLPDGVDPVEGATKPCFEQKAD